MTTKLITREEAKKLATTISSVIPGSTVRTNAWNVTVISKSGKHLVCYTGSKDGFKRVQ